MNSEVIEPSANDPNTIITWLLSLPMGSSVFISDDNQRLVVGGNPYMFLELGNHPIMSCEDFEMELAANCATSINPADHFRDMLYGREFGDLTPELEKDDPCAFNQMKNDMTDSMVKNHEWVSFDYGTTYYAADDVKEVIEENSTEFYSKELKEILYFWL